MLIRWWVFCWYDGDSDDDAFCVVFFKDDDVFNDDNDNVVEVVDAV